ncbi:hypothetical protein MTO96_037257 [Rhipicephalus appendiculatus]
MARRVAVGKRSRYLRKTKAKWHSGTFESLTAPTGVRRRGRVFVGSTLLALLATEEGHDSDAATLTELPLRMKKTCVPPPVCRAHRATCSDSEWGGDPFLCRRSRSAAVSQGLLTLLRPRTS